MAYPAHTTKRPLARINPSWTPAPQPLGLLGPFFNGRQGPAPIFARPAPIRPAPEMAVMS